MKKLRIGLVGFGFVGPHHLDAIRRLGFAEVTALATSSPDGARTKARAHFVEKSYGNWRELIADPDIDVVDIAAPTHLHEPVALAALKARKHVIVDKPMALTSAEAKRMLAAARRADVVHAVTFNIRYNAMVQQARAMIANGAVGDVRLVRGHYLQEWLLKDTDFNWRLEPGKGGALAMVADAGAHWYDLSQHVTGHRITRVLADLSIFIPTRQPSLAERHVLLDTSKKGISAGYQVSVPDLGMILCEFENGARGHFATSALCAGHKNDLTLEVCGARASVRWEQERPDELWIGHRDEPNQILKKDPLLLDPSIRHYAALPGGHGEAWPDAFRNLMRNILTFVVEGRKPSTADELAFPTFATGLRVAQIIDAIAASARAGGRWRTVAR